MESFDFWNKKINKSGFYKGDVRGYPPRENAGKLRPSLIFQYIPLLYPKDLVDYIDSHFHPFLAGLKSQ